MAETLKYLLRNLAFAHARGQDVTLCPKPQHHKFLLDILIKKYALKQCLAKIT